MHYWDKREAKIRIMGELVNKGWKVYGYKEDNSDSMTDYFDPASWDGIATKNGYTLLVDQYDTHYSGYEVKKYDYSNAKATQNNYAKIEKLQALANDPAATEGEKAAAMAGIERLKDTAPDSTPSYTVVETYPTFSHANPGKCSWHIEKDGQIIAKGNGVFACNEYDWEDKTRTAAEQKQEKVVAIVERFEKALRDADALEPEVIKVAKKVIKPVEKAEKTIQVNNILSTAHHGHFWIVTDIYTVGEQVRVTYELLGSAKRGYQRLSGQSVKRYWQPLQRLEKSMEEGKTKVYTLQEVTEYEEKTVFKKTARKQPKANMDAQTLPGDVEEVEQATQAIVEGVSVKYNDELNGVEITFSSKPDSQVIEGLKANGFRWSKRGFWYAKQNAKTKTFAAQFEKSDTTGNAQDSGENLEEVTDSIIDYTASLMINTRRPETEEEKTVFAEELREYMTQKGYKVSLVLDYVKANHSGFNILIEALETLKNAHNSKQEQKRDQSEYIAKIDKQIASTQSKLDALSGDYLTNTWKRQQEEASRENKREALRFDISLLEYLKGKAAYNSMTPLEIGLMTGSTRETIKAYHSSKYKYNNVIEWPDYDSRYPDGWWNKEKEYEKRQKKLAKANIYNLNSLITAIEEYNGIISEIEKPVNLTEKKIKDLEMKMKLIKIDGYFPTPKTIVERMVNLADIQDGETILEPSAGNGNILDGITAHLKNCGISANLDGIEWNYSLSEILKLKNYNIVGDDFLQYNNFNYYDKILMNPPFEKNQDIEHVKHAYKCLKNGGRIVAIMSPHFTFASDAKSVEFREWLDGRGYYDKLPEGSFKESGTNTNTVIVVIDKLEEVTEAAQEQPQAQPEENPITDNVIDFSAFKSKKPNNSKPERTGTMLTVEQEFKKSILVQMFGEDNYNQGIEAFGTVDELFKMIAEVTATIKQTK